MKRYHIFLIAVFLISWILLSIHPWYPQDWFQENIMTLLWVPTIIVLGQYFLLSDLTYTIITIYLILHIIGAHYSYAQVPFGDTLGHMLGTGRNEYDRLLHFSFGFLIIWPIRELFVGLTEAEGFWSYFLPVNIIMSFSALYEIFEWLSVRRLPPDIGYLFIGGSDPWDTQKDMMMAFCGAVASTLLAALVVSIRTQIKKRKIPQNL